jgi:hypothetical protein
MDTPKRNKAGRPKKKVTMQEQLAVMCTVIDRKIIEHKAKKAGMSISSFLREIGLKGEVNVKTYPKEILAFTGRLNHLAANINQIAKKRNLNESLSPIDRAELKMLSEEIKELSIQIKKSI